MTHSNILRTYSFFHGICGAVKNLGKMRLVAKVQAEMLRSPTLCLAL